MSARTRFVPAWMLHLNLARFPPRDNSIVKYLGLKDHLKSESRTKGSIVEYLDRPEGLAGLPAHPHLLLVALGGLPVADALPLGDEDAGQPPTVFLLVLVRSSVPTPWEPSNSTDLSSQMGVNRQYEKGKYRGKETRRKKKGARPNHVQTNTKDTFSFQKSTFLSCDMWNSKL